MKFINRHKEMQRLDRVAHLTEGGVIVIWGRRRLGKTRLLLEWSHRHAGVYYTADESAPAVQRKYFALALESALPGFSAVEYPDWTTFLNRLAKDAMQAQWRGPLIIDELPYLIAASPELPSILQKFIDREAKQAKLIIAFCGSSQRMMQGAILDASAPLFGRAKELIKLSPISMGYITEALGVETPREAVESYAIWGGIPRYWELVKDDRGELLENIDRLVLDPMGPLNDEPNRLLLEEMPPAISLRPILDAIGLGAHRLSEIGTRIGQPTTSLGRPIQRLIELDLIEREMPFRTEEHHSKRTLYKLKDPFVRFWFEIVAPQRSYLAQTTPAYRRKWLKEKLPALFAMMWEETCRLAVPSLSLQWGEPTFGLAGRYWHGQGPEWDLIATSTDGTAWLIGEAKWTAKVPTASWIEKTISLIRDKGLPPLSRPQSTQVYYTLFIPEKPRQLSLPEHVRVVDAAEILQALH